MEIEKKEVTQEIIEGKQPIDKSAEVVQPIVENKEETKVDNTETGDKVVQTEKKTILGGEIKPPETEPKAKEEPAVIEELTLESIKYPDTIQINKEEAGAFVALANTLGLKKEQVQGIIDFQVKTLETKTKEYEEKSNKAFEEQAIAWETESKAKFGLEFDKNLGLAKKAYEKYATKGFRELMENTKLGNHPDIIETFKNVGVFISNDTVVTPSINPNETKKPMKFEDHYKNK